MLILKLAFKNLLGGGLRTWLNALALSISFVIIIMLQGLYSGMGDQMKNISIEGLYADGQYWQQDYDPYDALTLDDAHGKVAPALQKLIVKKQAVPILIRRANIFPQGRIQNIMLKGITPKQNIISVPSSALKGAAFPGLIGTRMAKNTKLKIGDTVMVRWKNGRGQYDAAQIEIVQIMKTNMPEIDAGQIWLPLEKLRSMTGMKGEATVVVLKKWADLKAAGWAPKNLDFLMADIDALVAGKTVGGSIMYTILMLLAMLGIFDTQIFSIFRRRKEIGTLIALGMTRWKVIQLFTLEGALNAVLAGLLALIYGTPLLLKFAETGMAIPEESIDSYGMAMGKVLYPTITIGLIIGTTLLIFLVTTIVSYMPARKIAKLDPTEALRGKLS
jgi:putative ABC transport system permease protein